MNAKDKVVFITGCSSGIGEALCEEFHQRGFRVVATGRRIEALQRLHSKGIYTEQLDVNSEDDISRVVDATLSREGSIDILINNAGYALIGPVIDLSTEDLLLQIRTNIMAPLSLAKKVAPSMRANGGGVIVNMGSISGIVPTPFAGAYCASKAALHAFSDALRMELSPFGIKVVTVQPGAIKSKFGDNASMTASKVIQPGSWYTSVKDGIISRAQLSQVNATPTVKFAGKLVDLLVKDDPPAVIRLGKMSTFFPSMKYLLPGSVMDRILKKKFGISSMPSPPTVTGGRPTEVHR